MNSDYNNNIHSLHEENINLQELFLKFIHFWRWFLISTIIVGLITAYYLRRTIPEYNVSATILIKDAKKGVGDAMSEIAAFQDLGLFSNSLNSLDNEIEILKSRSLLAKVIKKLKLNVQYTKEGPIRRREYYNNQPIQLQLLGPDSLQNLTNADFILTILSSTEYHLENEDLGSIGSFSFGEKVNTPYGPLRFDTNFTNIPSNPVVNVRVTPLLSMANYYSEKINVTPLNKHTSVIKISLEDAVKSRAQDFINVLIKQYNADGIDEKNQVSKNTAEFIDNRLKIIREELNQVESNVALYKQSNKLTDISAEAGLFLENNVNTKKEVLKLSTELSMVQFMIDYLVENNNQFQLLPANIGLTDVSISNSVATYNTLVLERNRILKNSSIQNPIVQNLDLQITDLRQALESSLQNLKKAFKIQLSSIEQETEKNNSLITLG